MSICEYIILRKLDLIFIEQRFDILQRSCRFLGHQESFAPFGDHHSMGKYIRFRLLERQSQFALQHVWIRVQNFAEGKISIDSMQTVFDFFNFLTFFRSVAHNTMNSRIAMAFGIYKTR